MIIDRHDVFEFTDALAVTTWAPLGTLRDLHETLKQEIIILFPLLMIKHFLPDTRRQYNLTVFVGTSSLNAVGSFLQLLFQVHLVAGDAQTVATICNTDYFGPARVIIFEAALALEFFTGFFSGSSFCQNSRFVVEKSFSRMLEELLGGERRIPPKPDQQRMGNHL